MNQTLNTPYFNRIRHEARYRLAQTETRCKETRFTAAYRNHIDHNTDITHRRFMQVLRRMNRGAGIR